MKAYSRDLRERIVAAVAAGRAQTHVATTFSVHRSTVARYLAQHQQTGDLIPKTSPGRPRAIPLDQAPALRAQVEAAPAATLAEHCTAWAQTAGVTVHVATMARALIRLGFTRKKR